MGVEHHAQVSLPLLLDGLEILCDRMDAFRVVGNRIDFRLPSQSSLEPGRAPGIFKVEPPASTVVGLDLGKAFSARLHQRRGKRNLVRGVSRIKHHLRPLSCLDFDRLP